MSLITEEQVELQSIEWFKELGYQYKDGYEIAPEGVNPERDDFRKVILEDRLKSSLTRINPDIPIQTINNATSEILNLNIPGLMQSNREMHKLMTKGLKVIFTEDNQEVGKQLKLIDYDNIENKNYPAVFITSSLYDSQVQYFEPAKYTAKLREFNTSGAPILMKMNLIGGHGGMSGKINQFEEIAEEYTFILNLID